jgi:hypothetical protein
MTSPPYPPAAALAAFVREQASWRRTQADRFPADRLRNARSAIALERLALHVEEYREGQSPHLTQLVELGAFSDGSFSAGPEARRAVARWGFDEDLETNLRTFRDLLQELVAITRRARQTAQMRNTQMTAATETTRAFSPNAAGVLEEIFDLAMWHDRRCVAARAAVQRRLHLTANGPNDNPVVDRVQIEEELNELHYARIEVAAVIAVAALGRVQVLAPFLRGMRDRGTYSELQGAELEAFLRPIFEESGIGDRWVDGPDAGLHVPATMTANAAAIGVALSGKRNPEHRVEMLDQLIGLANAGDQVAIEWLEANPELAFQDRGTWVPQVDSGPRSPGLAAGRDREGRGRIVRTRPQGDA